MAGKMTETMNESKKPSLLEIAKKSWTQEAKLSFPASLKSVRIIRGQVFCCHEEGIAIYDLNLRPEYVIRKEKVNDVVEYGQNDLVIATEGGLCHITSTGKEVKKIDDGAFYAVHFYDGLLYASAVSTSTVHTYNPSKGWEKKGKIVAGYEDTASNITFAVQPKTITTCSEDWDMVRVYSKEDGSVFHTYGEHGTADEYGKLAVPYICWMDDEGSTLIADRDGNLLQVVNALDKWSALKLDGLETPTRAAYHDGRMYIVGQDPNAIYMYIQN